MVEAETVKVCWERWVKVEGGMVDMLVILSNRSVFFTHYLHILSINIDKNHK